MSKKIIFQVIIAYFIIIVSYSHAGAQISSISAGDTGDNFWFNGLWDMQNAEIWTYTGSYWDVYFTIEDQTDYWHVSWEIQHIDHPEFTGTPGPLLSDNDTFLKTTIGNSYFLKSGGALHLLNPNPSPDLIKEFDGWRYSMVYNPTSTSSRIELLASHHLAFVPEPISAILFITGSAILGFRRFCRKRKNN